MTSVNSLIVNNLIIIIKKLFVVNNTALWFVRVLDDVQNTRTCPGTDIEKMETSTCRLGGPAVQ